MLTDAEQDILEAMLIRAQTEVEGGIKADMDQTGECRACYLLTRDHVGLLLNWLSEKRFERKKANNLKTLQALQANKDKGESNDQDKPNN